MLQFFRKFMSSKLGIGITLGFLILIALAFASGDVASSGGFGGVAGGDRVASVGGSRINTSDVERSALNAVENIRREDPSLTVRTFVARNGLEQLLDFMIDRRATLEFGKRHGVHIGNALIDHEIAKIPGLRGVSGEIDVGLYNQLLANQKESDASFRLRLEEDLVARQLLGPASLGATMPGKVLLRYAAMQTEQRQGLIATLPSAAFAPKSPPSDAEISAWYGSHQASYALPERRTIRYVVFDASAIKTNTAPTEAELAARYGREKARFAATNKRKIAQLVLPTEAAAKAVVAEVGAGKSLDAAASAKGLGVAALGSLTREAYALQASSAAADGVFAAPVGKVVGPFKAPLGWIVARVDAKDGSPGKTLEQARAELTKELAQEKLRAALTDYSARIEDEFDNGATLSDVAKELGKTVEKTAPLTADGAVFGQQGKTAPPVLAKLVATAFSMEGEGQAQLAEVEAGKTFVMFDVGAISAAAPPPLAEIKQVVATDVMLSKGATLARDAAKKVEAQVAKGMPLELAVASLGVSLPPIDRVDRNRQEIVAMGRNAPPPLVVLFTTPKGKLKLLAAPRNRGWYVVKVNGVTPGSVAANDPRLINFAQEQAAGLRQEYDGQLRKAMRDEVGVKQNPNALRAVRARLLGSN